MPRRALLYPAAALVLAASCSGGTLPETGIPTQSVAAERVAFPGAAFGGGKIAHVVVIMQENRSFDNLFHDYPGADTVDFGDGVGGKRYRLRPRSLANKWDMNHAHVQFLEDYYRGKNIGWNREIKTANPSCPDPLNHPACWIFYDPPNDANAYSYVPSNEVRPYWTMAREYALADHAFQSNNGPSYPSHQFMIAGQSRHVVENLVYPTTISAQEADSWGCDSPANVTTLLLHYGSQTPRFAKPVGIETPGPYPCFDYDTIANRLDRARVSWAYYAPAIGANLGAVWSAFDAIWPVRFGRDWYRNVDSPETRIFNDVQAGKLANVSWVVPSIENSDHAGSRSLTGPDWVGSIVNAIGHSRYWKDTAIVVMWDDWGGWFDHVIPPQYRDAETHAFEGLGYRVPAIVISPYAKRGYVSHRRHEIASSLRLIENVFGLPTLGQADARADGFDDMFDFAQKPLPFRTIPVRLTPDFFVRQPPADRPPDDD